VPQDELVLELLDGEIVVEVITGEGPQGPPGPQADLLPQVMLLMGV
jgi:hypothetical protein